MDDDRTVGAVDCADFQQVPGGVGADEHRQAVIEVIDQDWVVEGVDHVVVVDAVLASARGDQRSIHASQVSLHEVRWQVVLHAIVPDPEGAVRRPHEDRQTDASGRPSTGDQGQPEVLCAVFIVGATQGARTAGRLVSRRGM
jgi:hypothetical protein